MIHPFCIESIKGRGNGLIASRNIVAGELIYCEKPWSWCSKSSNFGLDSQQITYCYQCGKQFPENEHISCPLGCRLKFCNESCYIKSVKTDGHLWLCSSIKDRSLSQLDDCNSALQAHGKYFILALKEYAKLAQKFIDSSSSSCSSKAKAKAQAKATTTPMDAAKELLESFHTGDSLKCLHAIRTSSLLVDEGLFEDLIAPAYFESFLKEPLSIFKQIFTPYNSEWKGNNILAEEFISSDLFSQAFIRKLIGIFMCNTLTIGVDYETEPCVSITSGPTVTAGGPLVGTGLYYLYSKMNHACVCNTYNGTGASIAEVSVYARRDITVGDELTTSYLHISNPHEVSRKMRNRSLKQYLFDCVCPLCEAQSVQGGGDDDDDSDDDY